MEYTYLKRLLMPLGCLPMGEGEESAPIVMYRRLERETVEFRENILYLGRAEDFAALPFPAQCRGFSVPQTISFDFVYAQLDAYLSQSTATLSALSLLLNALWTGKNLQKIVDIASDLLENPVTINNFAFLPLAESQPDTCNNINYMLRQEFLQESKRCQFSWYNAHRKTIDEDIPKLYCSDGREWLLSTVKVGQITVAWIVVHRICRSITDRDIEIVQILRNVIATYFMTENNFSSAVGKYQDIFLRDLLSGTYTTREAIDAVKRQIHFLNYDSYCIIAVKWSTGTPDNSTLNSILQQIRILMPDNPAIFHERYFAILLGQKQDTGGLLNSNYVLREFLAINKLQAGMSRSFSNLLETPKYFAQAISTLEALGKLYPQELLIRYGSNLVFQMVHTLSKYEDVRMFRHPAVEFLEEYDRDNATELSHTLEVYLKSNHSPSATSQALFIHRNTLTKRLQKIKSLTHLELEDSRIVTQLLLTYAINDYIQANTI